MSWIQPWNILPLIWKLFRKWRDFFLTRLKVCQVLVGPFYKGWWAKYFCRQSWETGTQNDAREIYKEFFSYQGRDLIQDSSSLFLVEKNPEDDIARVGLPGGVAENCWECSENDMVVMICYDTPQTNTSTIIYTNLIWILIFLQKYLQFSD